MLAFLKKKYSANLQNMGVSILNLTSKATNFIAKENLATYTTNFAYFC